MHVPLSQMTLPCDAKHTKQKSSVQLVLIMLSWYPFSFNTCFILAFSFKSSLFVIMEYALLNHEEATLSLKLVGCDSCSVGIGEYV